MRADYPVDWLPKEILLSVETDHQDHPKIPSIIIVCVNLGASTGITPDPLKYCQTGKKDLHLRHNRTLIRYNTQK